MHLFRPGQGGQAGCPGHGVVALPQAGVEPLRPALQIHGPQEQVLLGRVEVKGLQARRLFEHLAVPGEHAAGQVVDGPQFARPEPAKIAAPRERMPERQ